MKSILLVKKFWGLVEMTSRLVNPGFNLPEWQAAKMILFAPCCIYIQFFLIARILALVSKKIYIKAIHSTKSLTFESYVYV